MAPSRRHVVLLVKLACVIRSSFKTLEWLLVHRVFALVLLEKLILRLALEYCVNPTSCHFLWLLVIHYEIGTLSVLSEFKVGCVDLAVLRCFKLSLLLVVSWSERSGCFRKVHSSR